MWPKLKNRQASERAPYLIIVALLVAVTAGCAPFWKSEVKDETPTAEELFNKAEVLFAKEDFHFA